MGERAHRADAGPGLIGSSAAALLHGLRVDAGLSQERLAERCGISDRTVRGLETATIRTPQRATLMRLSAALALTVAQREVFLRAWSDQSRLLGLESLVRPSSVLSSDSLRTYDAQARCTRQLAHWDYTEIGPDRTIRRSVGRRSFVMTRGSLDRCVVAYSYDPSAVDGDHPRVSDVHNCRLATTVPFGPDAILLEFAFDQTLRPGDAYTFGYEIDHGGVPDPDTARPERDSLIAVRAPGMAITLEVRFDPRAMPAAVRHVQRPAVDRGPTVTVDQIDVTPFGVAQLVIEHPSIGIHGLAWDWDG